MNQKISWVIIALFTLILFSCSHAQKESNHERPHSPYLIDRETVDNGFSRGWMPHFLPSEEYWVDMHVHLDGVATAGDLKYLLDSWFGQLDAYRLARIVAIVENEELFPLLGEAAENDARFAWMYWPRTDAPSLASVKEAVRNRACALKLHNMTLMEGKTPRTIWQSDEWQAIFSFAEATELPLLWHVTQRLGYSPYHGGGLNAYWKTGWANGVDFTNEDLLEDMLTQMRNHPKLKVIGAHQLHIGLDRLTQLFNAYENLYIDSSCGMYLRWADDFIEKDRVVLFDFIEKWSERIVFGTDAALGPKGLDEYAVQGFLCHARFLLKLGLNDKALQDIAWRNSEQLLHLKPGNSARRGNVRP